MEKDLIPIQFKTNNLMSYVDIIQINFDGNKRQKGSSYVASLSLIVKDYFFKIYKMYYK